MTLSEIPVRANDTFKIYAGWFNDIRSFLVSIFGLGAVVETQFTIADNQSSYQNITGLVFTHTVTRAVKIEYTIYRTNGGATERREVGHLILSYKAVAAAWSFSRVTDHGDDALNVANSLNVTSAGQVQYKSDSIGATYVGTIRYKVIMAFTTET